MKQNLGEYIAQLRKEKGLTQRELAEHLNVTDKTVSHWERGESSPDISALPILADIFGITVDELLKGERRAQKQATSIAYIGEPPENFVLRNYNRFKIQNMISAAIPVISLISGAGIRYLLLHFVFTQAANAVALFVTLAGVFICFVLTVIFNVLFRNKLYPDSDSYRKHCFAADRISSLNFYFGTLCLSAVPCFMRKHGFIFSLIALTVILAVEFILTKKGVLSTEKAFDSKIKESICLLRKSCAVLCAILIIIGGGIYFFFIEVYHPTVKNIVFTSSDEFKAYMETPQEKPDDAYLADGVSVTALVPTTLPPTTAPDGSVAPSEQQSPVEVLPQGQESEDDIEEIYNANGEVILTFRNLNKSVKSYAYNEETGTYHIITYEEAIRVQKLRNFKNTTIDRLVPLYCLAVAGITFIVYKRKLKEITP